MDTVVDSNSQLFIGAVVTSMVASVLRAGRIWLLYKRRPGAQEPQVQPFFGQRYLLPYLCALGAQALISFSASLAVLILGVTKPQQPLFLPICLLLLSILGQVGLLSIFRKAHLTFQQAALAIEISQEHRKASRPWIMMVISMTCLGFVCVGGFWLSPPTRRRTIFIFVAIILHSLHTGCQWGLIAWAVWKPRLSSLDSKVGSLWLTLMEFDSVVAYMVIFGYAVTTTTDEATHMYWTSALCVSSVRDIFEHILLVGKAWKWPRRNQDNESAHELTLSGQERSVG